MATYNKNEMLPQRQDALEMWGDYIHRLVSIENERYTTQNFEFEKDVTQ